MNNINLNIDNYNCQELEELLSLSVPYTRSDILNAQQLLKEKIKKKNIENNKKQNILLFLDNIYSKLINNLNDKNLKGTYTDPINNIEEVGNHFIIKNMNSVVGKTAEIWNGRNVDTNEYPPGHLNPINIKTIKRSINIDTKFRPDYFLTKSTDFTLTLPERINKVVSMRLSSIEIPLSFYAISEQLGNTNFILKYTDGGVLKTLNVRLPPGNYENRFSNRTKAAFIENAINDAMQLANSGIPCPIIFNVDIKTGKSIFAADISGGLGIATNFELYFNVDENFNFDNTTPLFLRLGWELGFRAGSYTGETAISEGVCFVNGPQYVYVAINDYHNSSNNFFRAAFTESILSPYILGRINITKALQSQGIYKSGADDNYNDSLNRTREYFGPVDIQRLTISLYDEYGRILDLNNMDWSFVLSFVCLYD